jgi:two-component system response regulator HydG
VLAPRTNPAITGVDDAALDRLMQYRWPGNVRELENVIEQALVFADGTLITPAALPEALREAGPRLASAVDPSEALASAEVGQVALPDLLDDLERQLILKAFTKAGGVKTETARLLGIKTSALYYKLEKYGIG